MRFLAGLTASVNFVFLLRASAVPKQACSARHSAWCRFGMTTDGPQRLCHSERNSSEVKNLKKTSSLLGESLSPV